MEVKTDYKKEYKKYLECHVSFRINREIININKCSALRLHTIALSLVPDTIIHCFESFKQRTQAWEESYNES